jgi:xanthine/CO dehydrogenase XdhC/CoxF family maturation factor
MQEIAKIVGLYDRFRAEGVACALATVVAVAGSSYRRIGARLLVGVDGRFVGGISGGCLEGDALRRARQVILLEHARVQVYDTLETADRVIGIGLGCNGRIEVLFKPIDLSDPDGPVEVLRSVLGTRRERILVQTISSDQVDPALGDLYLLPEGSLEVAGGRSIVRAYRDYNGRAYHRLLERVRPSIRLVLIGNNYDVLPTVRTAAHLGWGVTLIGARRKFTREITDLAEGVHDYSTAASTEVDEFTAVVCMSHDYDHDLRMLRHFVARRPPYLGLLGPRKRSKKLATELSAASGIDLFAHAEVHAPVGLDIGAETPEEIAIALVAEIIAVFRDRRGQPLRDRRGPIYPR